MLKVSRILSTDGASKESLLETGHTLLREDYDRLISEIKPLPHEVFYVGDIEIIRNPTGADYRGMANEIRSEIGNDFSGDPLLRYTLDSFGNRWIWKATEGLHNQIEPLISQRERVEVGQSLGIPSHSSLIRDAVRAKKQIPLDVQAQYPNYAEYFPRTAMLKVSKLLEDPTESPAFQAWFAGSKVVDAAGKPARVFHGTDKKFNSFNLNKTTQGIIWFTSDKASVEAGDVGAQGRGVIMELYACIKNPAGWKEYDQYGLGELKARGFDGAILPEKDGSFTGFVFHPHQLKSVANKGKWDPKSHYLTASYIPRTLTNFKSDETNGAACDIFKGFYPKYELGKAIALTRSELSKRGFNLTPLEDVKPLLDSLTPAPVKPVVAQQPQLFSNEEMRYSSEIDPNTPYYVVDIKTGEIVGKYIYKNRNRARAFKDRKDQEYGAVRYVCKLG